MPDSTKAMLLAIDIGNTNVTIGVFNEENLLASWRLSTDSRRLADEYALQLRGLHTMISVLSSNTEANTQPLRTPGTTQLMYALLMHNGIFAMMRSRRNAVASTTSAPLKLICCSMRGSRREPGIPKHLERQQNQNEQKRKQQRQRTTEMLNKYVKIRNTTPFLSISMHLFTIHSAVVFLLILAKKHFIHRSISMQN
mgnify:CR=1 FL=1